MIRLEGVSKAYVDPRGGNGLLALRSIDLEVGDGELLCVLGPSGCGKSTMLRMVAGLEDVTRGRLTVDGSIVDGPSRRVGMVFQDPSLFPWMSVLDNVSLASDVATAEDCLSRVGLSEFADSRPNELSGGMRQRVSIARMLAMGPGVILMDEPFGALDEQTRRAMDSEVLRLREDGTTILFVTHSMDEALTIADRIVLMSPGPGTVMGEWRLDDDAPRDPWSDRSMGYRRLIQARMGTCSCLRGVTVCVPS